DRRRTRATPGAFLKLALTVNGERRDVDVPPSTSLLSVLRDDLGLTGTRYGCGRGQCGACYVLADDRAVASCLLTADQAARTEITTVEGLADGAKLHPVQQAFVDGDALQCGRSEEHTSELQSHLNLVCRLLL